MSGTPPRSLWQVFRWPLLLAAASFVGLLSALLGDGVWDALSWLAFAPVIAISALGLARAARKARRRP